MRWQLDQQKMGTSFRPFSICTDGSTVFVTDPGQVMLHLLSVEDGSVLTSIRLHKSDIHFPCCLRVQGEHLFVGHENEQGTYFISKFTKPNDV